MVKKIGIGCLAAVIAMTQPAGAQTGAPAQAAPQAQTPQPRAPDILVTGERNMERQVRDFVGALARAPVNGQLGRFEQAACPIAIGFVPSQKVAVERRLQAVAQAAGLAAGRPDCTPNMLVIATADKRAFLAALRQRYGYLFGEMSYPGFRRLLNQSGPASAWHVRGQRDGDGLALNADFSSGTMVNRGTGSGSRITAGSRTQFQAGAIVIETGALQGLTTTQVADYAAMRLLAATEPPRLPAGAAETILSALEAPMGAEIPLTLTRWDLGYLRGLYGASGNLTAPAQRGEIGRTLARELQQPR